MSPVFITGVANRDMKRTGSSRQMQAKVLAVVNTPGYCPSMVGINNDRARHAARHFSRSNMQAYESSAVQ